jgi:hypothetical protein
VGWSKSVVDENVIWMAGSSNQSLQWIYSNGAIEGHDELKFNGIFLASKKGEPVKRYLVRDAQEFNVADQAVGMRVFGAAGWGAAGAILAGPVGALVGGLLGGRAEKVTFMAKFADGDTMMGQVPKKTWLKMAADRF